MADIISIQVGGLYMSTTLASKSMIVQKHLFLLFPKLKGIAEFDAIEWDGNGGILGSGDWEKEAKVEAPILTVLDFGDKGTLHDMANFLMFYERPVVFVDAAGEGTWSYFCYHHKLVGLPSNDLAGEAEPSPLANGDYITAPVRGFEFVAA